MTDERPRADRESPVGEPVIRGDAAVTGDHADEAVRFDPDDPGSVEAAVDTVRAFAAGEDDGDEPIYVLRAAAACAALVRAEGSYKAAAERGGADVSVSFIRKWARVHDLPRAVRRHVARGDIAPSAAKHVARVRGEARYLLAWATLDAGLTVREVRALASEVAGGTPADDALREAGVEPGELALSLPVDAYVELRRRASLADDDPAAVVTDLLRDGE